MPVPIGKPWPRDPVETFIPGTLWLACCIKMLLFFPYVKSVFLLINPNLHKTQYKAKQACPLLRIKVKFIIFFIH